MSLITIWYVSLCLALFSIVIVLGLFVRRLIITWRKLRRDKRRRELSHAIIVYLDAPGDVPLPLRKMSARDQWLTLGIATRLMKTLKGDSFEALKRLLDDTLSTHLVIKGLESGPISERANTAGKLFWADNPDIVRALERALDDPAEEVVLAAASSLTAAKVEIDVREMAEKIVSRGLLGNRGVRTLFRDMATRSSDDLDDLLDSDNPDMVILIADALGIGGQLKYGTRLIELAESHPDLDVRAEALRSLANLRHPNAMKAVMSGLNDPAWQVRAQAAICAGRVRLEPAVPYLTKAVDDPVWWVAYRSAQALKKIGEEGTRELERLASGTTENELAALVLMEDAA